MNTYTLTEEAKTAFQVLQKYWTETYPNASLIISQQPQISDEHGLHQIVIVGTPPTRNLINDLLTDCLIASKLTTLDYSNYKLEDLLPVVRSTHYGRQLEIFAEIERRIQQKPPSTSRNEFISDLSILAHMKPDKLNRIAGRALKLFNANNGTKAYQQLSPYILHRLSISDFQRLIDGIEASNGFSAFFEGDDVTVE